MYADGVVLWSVSDREQDLPARAALQHGLNSTTRYIEEQEPHVSSSKTAMLVNSPSRRAPCQNQDCSCRASALNVLMFSNTSGLYIDDRINWRSTIKQTHLY